ncbi:MSHA biogenesis protein MshI [Pseudomonas oryzae]|uniref:MSHA biogenesis protein MshI n=1 Tax=Pseudomonas oryzae TaxID=1392877 RepID=A0A1H1WIC1_9PSED|nr:MSHA biogenesis protein MshI [Pseudomonas oryzae]SDS97057.1 hypothetical protein SAMN05216221_3102 [Pseudomonas oryzae]
MSAGTAMPNLNLYQPAQPASAGRPSRALLLCAVLALLLAVLGDAAWQLWRLHGLESLVATAEQEAAQAEAELATARREFREPQADPRLPQRLAEVERDNRELQRVADYLKVLQAERSGGFSPALDALAERHLGGVWLSTIRLEQGGRDLLLEGASQQPALLPVYLNSLGRSPAFAGRQFARFDLERDAADVLRFRLASQATTKEDGQ